MENLQKAKNLENLGDVEAAAYAYLDCFSESGEAWQAAKAGELFYNAKKISKAKDAYNKVLGCENNILYDKLIDFYVKIKDYSGASNIFERCYPLSSKSKKLAFADKLYSSRAYEYAERWYLMATGGGLLDEKNVYFTKLGNYEEGLNFFDIKCLSKADEHFIQSNYRFALMNYNKCAKKSLYAQVKCGECYFALKDFENAKKTYRSLVQKTDDAYYMFMLAECYNSEDIDVNTFENAIYWYEYALEKGCNLVYYHLGMCYQFGRGTAEDLQMAEKMYGEGVKYDCDRANCLCKLGNIYYNKGDCDKASRYYFRAAELGNARAYLNIAIAYFEREIAFFSLEQIKCFLAKAAVLGSKRAMEMIFEMKNL